MPSTLPCPAPNLNYFMKQVSYYVSKLFSGPELDITVKMIKIWTPEKLLLLAQKLDITSRVTHPNDADIMANSVHHDQTATEGAVRSGSTLFAQTCLSENLRSLRY